MKKLTIILGFVLLLATACSKDEDLPDPEPVTHKISYSISCNFSGMNINYSDANGTMHSFVCNTNSWDTTIVMKAGVNINVNAQLTKVNETVNLNLDVDKDGSAWQSDQMQMKDGAYVEVKAVVPE